MHLKLAGVLSLSALLVAGCSSVPTRVNKGPLTARTFSFLPQKPSGTGTYGQERQQIHATIQTAITRNLTAKGLTQPTQRGEVEVGYLIIVADNASTAYYDENFGYGNEASGLADEAHKKMGKTDSRDYVEVGALVIDLVDTATGRLLYRSFVHAEVLNLPAAERTERINRLVDSCLGSLRVAP
jgi:hypothetical protein